MPLATAQPIAHQPITPTQAASPPTPSASPAADPTAGRRGNPNLALAPRCGARTRAGCPCQAPAIRGKLRCRMHGGRSTGPRTAEGMARMRAARTIHGEYDADSRAFNRHHLTFMRRSRVRQDAVINHDRLPPELAARMNLMAPELQVPPRPTRGITRAEDRALLRAEAEALAPWKLAIALMRQARRAAAAANRATATAAASAAPELHAPERRRAVDRTAGAVERGAAPDEARPHAPERLRSHGVAIRPTGSAAARAEVHAPARPGAADGGAGAPEALTPGPGRA